MALRVENLEALTRGKESLERLRDGGAKVIARSAATLKRRLLPQAKRDIGAQYNLASREIGSRLRCTGDAASVTLTGLGRAQTLIKFGARQTASGVTASIEKGRTFTVNHAFIRVPAGAPGAGPQVLIRDAALSLNALPDKVQDIATVDRDKHGYPITLLGGPSVADMLRDPGREDRLSDFVQATFAAEVDRLAEASKP